MIIADIAVDTKAMVNMKDMANTVVTKEEENVANVEEEENTVDTEGVAVVVDMIVKNLLKTKTSKHIS